MDADCPGKRDGTCEDELGIDAACVGETDLVALGDAEGAFEGVAVGVNPVDTDCVGVGDRVGVRLLLPACDDEGEAPCDCDIVPLGDENCVPLVV